MPISDHHAKPRAFTLVEVLVVVVILGLAGALVVPALLEPGTLSVQAAGRMIIADILIAQNDAVAAQAIRQVVFEPAENRYRIADANGVTITSTWKSNPTTGGNYIVDFDEDNRFVGVNLQGASFGSTQVLAFDALGSPMNGGNINIASGNTQYRITVAPFTGRVTIAPTPPPP